MKKLIALLLALTLVVAFAGCEKKEEQEDKLPPVEALTAIQTLYEAYNTKHADTDYQLFLVGGGYENTNWEGPATVLNSDVAYLTQTLVIPEAEVSNIKAAASAMHGQNTNTFCAGAYNLVDGADYDAFATAVRKAIQGNRWMCGFPEKLLIVNVGDCLIIVYGNGQLVENFNVVIGETYAGAPIYYNEAIEG